jgi:phage gpG-like protein
MPGIVFEQDGSADRVAAAVGALAEKTANPRPVLDGAKAILAAGEAEVFSSEGTSIGESWQPLSDATVTAKGDDRILVMTGRLRRALGDPANVHVLATGAELSSSSVPYAHFHASGTSKMPARPFLGIGIATQRALSELVKRYMSAGE